MRCSVAVTSGAARLSCVALTRRLGLAAAWGTEACAGGRGGSGREEAAEDGAVLAIVEVGRRLGSREREEGMCDATWGEAGRRCAHCGGD